MSAATDSQPHNPGEGSQRQRKNFQFDLTILSSLLCSLPYPIPLPPQTCPPDPNIEEGIPDMINRMFHIVLYECDCRKPEDFEEMKDTAGLTQEHFEGIMRELYPNVDELALPEGNEQLRMQLDQVIGLMSIIEVMRDKGVPAPRFWLGERVTLQSRVPLPAMDGHKTREEAAAEAKAGKET